MQHNTDSKVEKVKGYPHGRRWSGRLAIHFNGNSFGQFGTNAIQFVPGEDGPSLIWVLGAGNVCLNVLNCSVLELAPDLTKTFAV